MNFEDSAIDPAAVDVVDEAMRCGPVIPVLIVDDADHAVELGRALLAGGIRVLEVTLRTPNALDVIQVLTQALPQAIVAAGTVTRPEQWEAAARAGAQFVVSPGLTPRLLDAARHASIPLLPGVATASELMVGMDAGFSRFKLFPAHQVGGVGLLKAWHSPFAQALFCPTGGVTPANAPEYLALPNVVCVGGSWLAPPALIQAGDWAGITRLATAAHALRAA